MLSRTAGIDTSLTGQVKGDGDPSCFCRVEDTGIPELQKWCHTLTVASRERAARNFLIHLKTFSNSVKSYVEGIGDVTVTDREAMRAKWESMQEDGDEDEDDMDAMLYGGGWASSDPLDGMDALDPYALAGLPRANLYSMQRPAAPKVDARGEPVGITPRLVKVRSNAHSVTLADIVDFVRRISSRSSANA